MFLDHASIGHGVHYPTPIHLQNAYRDFGYRRGAFPVAEYLAGRILSLPMFPEITRSEIESVARACRIATARRDFASEPLGAIAV